MNESMNTISVKKYAVGKGTGSGTRYRWDCTCGDRGVSFRSETSAQTAGNIHHRQAHSSEITVPS